jgi:S1-C subfamily serine protease
VTPAAKAETKALHMKRLILIFPLVILLALWVQQGPVGGAIYKYKNENGEWCFTNDPYSVPGAQEVRSEPSPKRQKPDLDERLAQVSPVRSEIDRARNATVAIKSSMGLGSGFFITEKGHILTNKHVVSPGKEVREKIDDKEKELRNRKDQLEREHDQLLRERARLEGAEGDQSGQRRRRLDEWMRSHRNRKKAFREEMRAFEDYKRRLSYPYDLRVVLVDNTELFVSILSVSYDYDLALLRLGGYKTPFIEPGDPEQLSHGDPLYAIGSPIHIGLKHTVTSGIFSGYREFEKGPFGQGAFLQTNAQISRGNSGGPLVTRKGKVVGINTLKLVGNGVEGLNFAIPIGVAMGEFKGYVVRRK